MGTSRLKRTRGSGRSTVAVTTGALAISGVALAGCASGAPSTDAATAKEARHVNTAQMWTLFGGNGYEAAGAEAGVVLVRPEPTSAVVPSQAPRETELVVQPAALTANGAALGDKAVYLASRLAGKPYRYGAAGPQSFDCSGLVQYVYKQLGKTLPRTTNEQFAATIRIARGQERPGDLIFFGRPGAVYHMGIYAGGGKMWVAPRTGDVVKLQKIWNPSYMVGRVR